MKLKRWLQTVMTEARTEAIDMVGWKGVSPRCSAPKPWKGFSGGSKVKNPPTKAGDVGLIPGSGRFAWRRKWQHTPVFLPGKFHGQRSLAGYSPCGHKESDMAEVTIIVQSLTWTQHTRLPLLLLFSCSAMSDSLQSHGLQQARLPLSFTISQSLLKLLSV